jgi:hypothetical protein
VQFRASAEFRLPHLLGISHHASLQEQAGHPFLIQVYERVSRIEQDRSHSPGDLGQKNTGSLYEPKTSSMAARIS